MVWACLFVELDWNFHSIDSFVENLQFRFIWQFDICFYAEGIFVFLGALWIIVWHSILEGSRNPSNLIFFWNLLINILLISFYPQTRIELVKNILNGLFKKTVWYTSEFFNERISFSAEYLLGLDRLV